MCDHNQMNQQWQKIHWGLQYIFWSFSIFHRIDFLNECFCNMLLKIHIISSIHHIFKIKNWWITKICFLSVHILANFTFHFERIISNYMKICELFYVLFSCIINYKFL
jgi:hypothetical protein